MHGIITQRFRFIALLSVCMIIMAPSGRAQDLDWQQKVDPALLSAAKNGDASFLVRLTEQADLSPALLLHGKEARAHYVYERLREVARRTQPALTAMLDAEGVPYRAFWISNLIAVQGNRQVLEKVARRAEVDYIYPDMPLQAAHPLPGEGARKTSAIEWNVDMIGAPTVWGMGYTGQGAVVGGQDTGYEWTHSALQAKYRGWDGATADHNYNWHDAIHQLIGGGSNPCGLDAPAPCDDDDHGTHTMGTMVGDDGGTNQIGVAPGARWVGCRNMERGNGTLSTYIECFEWFTAPTDLNGLNPDPSKSPHVINNSWSCPTTEGCNTTNFGDMEAALNALRAAGTVVVVSAGNLGSGCSTVNTPAAIFEGSMSVGSVTSSEAISSLSSRGPVTVDGSNRLKPNVVAPGSSVRSSIRGNGYAVFSGTSMAGPHVAATVALMISANPDLAGDVETLENILEETAQPRTSTQTCGGIPGTEIPNNTFGYGRIDAVAAVNRALELANGLAVTMTPINPPIIVPPAGGSFQYQLDVVNNGTASATFDLWLGLDGPGISRTKGPFSMTLAPGASFSRTPSQNIPGNAPAGTYVMSASVGSFPAVDASDSFTLEKSAAKQGTPPLIDNWDSNLAELIFIQTAAGEIPDAYALDQNYPNPFNPVTQITFDLPQAGPVKLQLFNILGQEVRTLLDGFETEGVKTVTWDATGRNGERLASGVYLYRLTAGDFVATRQMTLLK